ncbi:MAG TPA: GNAT family N-acetyltransferase [Nitriliruptorales bacterium]|nr:GNAT family N-acetyltransferase [Nitriliruptorales bacterium]
MHNERRHDQVVERDAAVVHLLVSGPDAQDALNFLGVIESQVAAPLVDESERQRLRALVSGATPVTDRWRPLLVRCGGRPHGYAGMLLPAGPGGEARGDLAVDRRLESCSPATVALFEGLRRVAARHRSDHLSVWIRHATDDDHRCARAAGFGVERELLVLGRQVSSDVAPPSWPSGMQVRAFQPGHDEDQVVRLLRDAYSGTADAGWDRQRFAQRRGYDWFDPDDLLVAEGENGELSGVHWTKRRRDGAGEVYNLAVHPSAQGTGLGRALLRAGLAHLHARGCADVILWVDVGNEPARRLYRSEGFAPRWTDVAFGTDLSGAPPQQPQVPRSPGGTSL